MTRTIAVAPIRKSVTVSTSPERAFDVFTAGITRWWSKQFSINASPIKEIVIEPRESGRWYERGEDGSECQWGKVLAWEPPARLVLAWQITPSFTFDPALVTEVEVRFIAEGGGTRVDLEHRLDAYGDAAEEMFKALDGGWHGLVDAFAQEAVR